MKPRDGKSRRCAAAREWSRKVRERDKKCLLCDKKSNLDAHHIVPWEEDENLRFDIQNGITYCRSCHISVEMKDKTHWKKGNKHSCESKKKMSLSRTGKTPWNKGKRKKNPKRKICRVCFKMKDINKFTPCDDGYISNRCKVCRNNFLKQKRIDFPIPNPIVV